VSVHGEPSKQGILLYFDLNQKEIPRVARQDVLKKVFQDVDDRFNNPREADRFFARP
jgi:hypothetical protein